MSINFSPRRGAILLCDFGPDPLNRATFPLAAPPVSMPPEMWKNRRVIVVSPDSHNVKHGAKPGLCMVVPCSAKPPQSPEAWDIDFAADSYQSFSRAVWAKCAMMMVVSHARLDRFKLRRGGYKSDYLSTADMIRIEGGMRAALGL